jgi:hypothetical protein
MNACSGFLVFVLLPCCSSLDLHRHLTMLVITIILIESFSCTTTTGPKAYQEHEPSTLTADIDTFGIISIAVLLEIKSKRPLGPLSMRCFSNAETQAYPGIDGFSERPSNDNAPLSHHHA